MDESGHQRLTGCIIAGGQARRMGGGDKCLRLLAGRSVLARLIERLGPQVDDLLINANGDPARFAAYGLPVISDSLPDLRGPLAGVLVAMDHAAARGQHRVVTTSADTPFLPPDFVARLAQAGQGRMAYARSGDRDHPVCALWPVNLRGALAAYLADPANRRVMPFLASQGAVGVPFQKEAQPGGWADPFLNLNTPEDLADAERLLLP